MHSDLFTELFRIPMSNKDRNKAIKLMLAAERIRLGYCEKMFEKNLKGEKDGRQS